MNLQGLMMRLVREVSKRGLSNLVKAIPSEQTRRTEPVPPPATPPEKLRLHFFSADFDSPQAAERFCFASDGPDLPVQMTVELAGAMIDLNEVELITDGFQDRLEEFLDPEETDDILLRMAGDNTLILMTERAFGGLAYELDDTETLTYLGAVVVDA